MTRTLRHGVVSAFREQLSGRQVSSLAYALIYPIAVPAVAFVLSLFLMPETRERSIWEEAATTQKA